MDLTPAGEALLGHVQRLQLALTEVAREVADLAEGRTGSLRIGAAPGFGEHRLMRVCAPFLKDNPKCRLKVVVGTNDFLMPALLRNELDLAFSGIVPARRHGLVQESLLDDELIFFSSARNPLARRKRLKFSDIASVGWVVPSADTSVLAWRAILDALEDRGLPLPSIVLESAFLLLRFQTVSDSRFVGFTSKDLYEEFRVRFSLARLHVSDFVNVRSFGISYREGGYLAPLASRFIDYLKRYGSL